MTTKRFAEVKKLLSRITMKVLGTEFELKLVRDQADKRAGDADKRPFIQVIYNASCSKTNKMEIWKGGKHYLSQHMTNDEIVKKAWVAFEMAIKHEVMEGFKVDGITLFNPHVDFEELLRVSHKEVQRDKI